MFSFVTTVDVGGRSVRRWSEGVQGSLTLTKHPGRKYSFVFHDDDGNVLCETLNFSIRQTERQARSITIDAVASDVTPQNYRFTFSDNDACDELRNMIR